MRIPCSISIGYYILICTILSSNLVDAKCDHFWLDRYEDVLPTINNRPEFPDPLTREFQVDKNRMNTNSNTKNVYIFFNI